jgi:hypothetical protein
MLVPIFSFITLVLAVGSIGSAADFPAMSVPDNAGVNTGVTARWLDDEDFDKIRRLGINYIRFDLFWDNIEAVKGQYDWDEFDRVIATIKRNGIKPVLILDYNSRPAPLMSKITDSQSACRVRQCISTLVPQCLASAAVNPYCSVDIAR